MKLTPKGQQRLEKLQRVEALIQDAKKDRNPFTAKAKAKEAETIIEAEAVGILKDAIIVIDVFEQKAGQHD